ncbi:MAG TPA: hypothetical protein VKZ83_00040, partial [Phototrophicaceae bacterium]|nr:hypothetical protein [Phototrophicaceae bacterium]
MSSHAHAPPEPESSPERARRAVADTATAGAAAVDAVTSGTPAREAGRAGVAGAHGAAPAATTTAHPAAPAGVLLLQRLAGNRATAALLHARVGPASHGPAASRVPVVQRSPGLYDEDGLDLQVSLHGTSVTWFFPPERLSEDLRLFLGEDPGRVDEIETAISDALHDDDGPLHENPVFLESPPVADQLRADLLRWPTTTALPAFAGLLRRRATARRATTLLYRVEQDLEAQGVDPGALDWPAELAAARAAPPVEVETVLDASRMDRYSHVLAILGRETAALAAVPEGPLHTETLATLVWDTFVDPVEPPEELGEEFPRTHSETFLEWWLPTIEEARFLPEDFDLESLRPGDASELDEERDYRLAAYLGGPAQSVLQLYLLDRWVGDPLRRSTESYLATVDLEALRADLLDHLTDDFLRWAATDDEYRLALWDEVARRTAFDGVAAVVLAGRAAQAYNEGLYTTFATKGPADLEPHEWAIANDPAGYAEATTGAAAASRELLAGLTPDDLEGPLLGWYERAFATLPGGDEEQALTAGAIAGLFVALKNLAGVIEGERTAARDRLRDELDLGYDDIRAVIADQATFADDFITGEWLPMLKIVALEQVEANKAELEGALADWPAYREQAAAKFRICAHALDDIAEKLESGDYESLEMDGQVLTADDLESVRTLREFCLGQAETLEDPERAEETRDQMQEAVDGFETVRANIESGEYEPIDYASAVYTEARARLGIDWYSEYTTLRSALTRWEVVPENPFLAYAIASWQWNEHVRKMDRTAAIFVALGMLTVASFVVPGAGGLVLGGIDLAVGLAIGIDSVSDAYDLLALARLDTDGTIRGVTVEQAESALRTSWLQLGLTLVLTAGIGAMFGRLVIRGRAAAAIPGDLTRLNALMRVNPVSAEKVMARVKDAYKAEELLELAGDSMRLERMLDRAADVRHLEYVLMYGDPAEIARLLDLAGEAADLARVLDDVPTLADAARLVEALDEPAQLARLLGRRTADRLLVVLDEGATLGDLERLFAVLDELPAGAAGALDDAGLGRMAARANVVELEAVLDLQRAGNADGLDDWVVFNARKGADELAEARLELREVRRLAAEHPDAVVRMGRERHAPERPGVPGERSKEFDIRVDRAGVPERSVEVTTVGDGVNNVGA